MPKAHPIQTNFTAGELSPRLAARVALGKYFNGCRTLKNMTVFPHGGAQRRGGTQYMQAAKNAAKKCRLIPFVFSEEQAYVLEFGDLYIRIYANGGRVESPPGTPVEITTPYTEADLPYLSFTQSADVLYLAHKDYQPRKVLRASHTSWSIETIEMKDGPFLPENSTDTGLYVATSTGGTITADGDIFLSGHVGSIWRIGEVAGFISIKEWLPNDGILLNEQRSYNGNVYEAENAGTSGKVPPQHTEGVVSDGSVNWRYINDGYVSVRIDSVTSATEASCSMQTSGQEIPASAVGGANQSKYWSEAAWSDVRGWPSVVTFFEERLWWGNSAQNPQGLWASVTADYENHKSGAYDDAALSYTLSSNQVNAIKFFSAGRNLLIGTTGSEFIASGSRGFEDAITPSNVRIVPHTAYGTGGVSPVRLGSSVAFLTRTGKRLLEYQYKIEQDGYSAGDLSILAEHITGDGVIDMAYAQDPESILWCVRSDGVLAGMTYLREHEVIAWHRHIMGGVSDAAGNPAQVESVAVIPGVYSDEVWLSVKRYVDGAEARHIERLSAGLSMTADQENAFFVDSGVFYDGAATSTITGLDHLEGETVQVLADGAVQAEKTVSSGQITLDEAASKVAVGLGYVSDLVTMSLEAGSADGTAQGKVKRISKATVRLYRSLGMLIGPDENKLDRVPFRRTGDQMDGPVPLFTGDRAVRFPGDHETSAHVMIRQDQPLPLTVLAIMPVVKTNNL